MSELRTCPSCGAQTSNKVCEYCGTTIPNTAANYDNIVGANPNSPQGFPFNVIPFKATENQAASIVRTSLKDLQNVIKYELSELGRSYHGQNLTIASTVAVYVPFNPLKDADKVKSLRCNCNTKELPKWFPTSLSGEIWKNLAYRASSNDEKRELNRASVIVPIKEKAPSFNGVDNFIVVGDTYYLPFWVITGQLGSTNFSAFVFAGGKEKPELVNIMTEEGKLKDFLRQANNYTYTDYQNAVKGRRAQHKKEVDKENKKRKRSSVIIWIFILLGAVAGLWFGSFMHLYTDAVGAILLGGLLALVGGGIGFLISMIFCKID